MSNSPMNEEDVKNMLVNPFSAIIINKVFTEEHELIIAEEDWVKANVKLINEFGAEAWLNQLLKTLKDNYS